MERLLVGRRALRWSEDGAQQDVAAPVICPLCERPIPRRARQSLHHLLPKLKGGARGETVRLHQICHSAIHARYSEAEIARRLADVAALREDPEIARFLAWVRTKPDDFHAPTRMTRGRRAAKREH
ncbi:HNH endonuclease [Methylobacterium sp. C25]|nr:HNH endonuclease [Methylobacterium sp. C25]